jgi:hypothetical protein
MPGTSSSRTRQSWSGSSVRSEVLRAVSGVLPVSRRSQSIGRMVWALNQKFDIPRNRDYWSALGLRACFQIPGSKTGNVTDDRNVISAAEKPKLLLINDLIWKRGFDSHLRLQLLEPQSFVNKGVGAFFLVWCLGREMRPNAPECARMRPKRAIKGQ